MLYLLTTDPRWNQYSLARFGFCFFLLQIKNEATVTHPSISVGVRPREQGMENDDRFIQVPDEHSLESRSARGEGRHKERQREKRQNQWRSLSSCKVILLVNRPGACICTPQGPESIWSPQQCAPSPHHMLSISYAFTLEWSIVTN